MSTRCHICNDAIGAGQEIRTTMDGSRKRKKPICRDCHERQVRRNAKWRECETTRRHGRDPETMDDAYHGAIFGSRY